tara:strand:- start:2567 stop:2806 length:240 start_codon:yes stop_codon:yes gene_type:complete
MKKDYKFKPFDLCRATLPNDKTFKCTLVRIMQQWDFPAWEVHIDEPGKLGWVTHIRKEWLTLIEAYDPEGSNKVARTWR